MKEDQYFISFHASSNPITIRIHSSIVCKRHLRAFCQDFFVPLFSALILIEFSIIFTPCFVQVPFQYCDSAEADNFISSLRKFDCEIELIFFSIWKIELKQINSATVFKWDGWKCGRVENCLDCNVWWCE